MIFSSEGIGSEFNQTRVLAVQRETLRTHEANRGTGVPQQSIGHGVHESVRWFRGRGTDDNGS